MPKLTAAMTRKLSQALAKAEAFFGLDVQMGSMDTQINIVEPALSSAGWDTTNPANTKRQVTENISLLLTAAEGKSLAICTLPQNSSVAGVTSRAQIAKEAQSKGSDFAVVTNGKDWSVFHVEQPDMAIMTFSTTDKNAASNLNLLSMEATLGNELEKAHAATTIDATVHEAAKVVYEDDAFRKLVAKQLRLTGSKVTPDDLRASLSRVLAFDMSAAAEVTPAAPTEPEAMAEPESKAEPEKVKAAPKPKAPKAKAKSAAPKAGPALAIPEWVDGADVRMQRKSTVAFARYEEGGKMTLMPGSQIVAVEGKTLGLGVRKARKEALLDGTLEARGKMLLVTKEITLKNPKIAAAYAAGTTVPDETCWVAKDGLPELPAELSGPQT